jgi:hypothetical protein
MSSIEQQMEQQKQKVFLWLNWINL